MAKFQTKAFANINPIVLPQDGGACWIAVNIEFGAVFAANDYMQVCTLPQGFRVLDWTLNLPDLDSGTALRTALGVSNATFLAPNSTDIGTGNQVWGTALTAGSDGLVVRNASNNSAQDAIFDSATIPGNREIVFKCVTAATGYTGNGKTGQLLMLVQG